MRVVLDCDPGNGVPGADIDDGLALGLALRSPELGLEAVTVVAGNVPVGRGVECALEILETADALSVPVHRGADRPLVADPRPWRTLLDARRDDPRARELWAGPEPARRLDGPEADPSPAAHALVDIVDRAPGEVTVVAVGPLTNIATAILIDPDWATKVQRLVMMGGAFEVPNVLQELNTSYDPEATHVVLSSSARVLMVPLDVTLQTRMRLDDVDRLDRAGTPLATYLGSTVRPWVVWLSERFGRDGCPLHDPLAVATLLDPDVVSTRSACLDIELAGRLTRGRTVAWDPAGEELEVAGMPLPDVRPVSVADGVHHERFLPLLLDRLTS
jgi:inosine-uridine nucleoside N-ribohydrolase